MRCLNFVSTLQILAKVLTQQRDVVMSNIQTCSYSNNAGEEENRYLA